MAATRGLSRHGTGFRLIRLAPVEPSSAARTAYSVIRPVSDAAYFFLGSAAALGAVDAPWVGWPLATGVYVRMSDGGVFRTRFSRMAELRRRLASALFVAVHRPFIVNVARIVSWENGKLSRIGVQVGATPGAIDRLPVSREGRRRVGALLA